MMAPRATVNAGASLERFARSSGVKKRAPQPTLVSAVAGAVIAANLGKSMTLLVKHLTADAKTGGEKLSNLPNNEIESCQGSLESIMKP